MKPDFNNNVPIYIQIMNEIKLMIVSGALNPGAKMDSVRDLAQTFGVNPNTMQRALAELERESLLYTERTSGRYITSDEGLIMGVRDSLADEAVRAFIIYMKKIGYTGDMIIEKIRTVEKGDEQDGKYC